MRRLSAVVLCCAMMALILGQAQALTPEGSLRLRRAETCLSPRLQPTARKIAHGPFGDGRGMEEAGFLAEAGSGRRR